LWNVIEIDLNIKGNIKPIWNDIAFLRVDLSVGEGRDMPRSRRDMSHSRRDIHPMGE